MYGCAKPFLMCCTTISTTSNDFNSDFQQRWCDMEYISPQGAEVRSQQLHYAHKKFAEFAKEAAVKIVEGNASGGSGGSGRGSGSSSNNNSTSIHELQGYPKNYRSGNVFFKLWSDHTLALNMARDMKELLKCEHPQLFSVPLVTVVMHRGVAVSAHALVPVKKGSGTLVTAITTSTQTSTTHDSSSDMGNVSPYMRKVSSLVNIDLGYVLGERHSGNNPVHVEAIEAIDGRLYVVGLRRVGGSGGAGGCGSPLASPRQPHYHHSSVESSSLHPVPSTVSTITTGSTSNNVIQRGATTTGSVISSNNGMTFGGMPSRIRPELRIHMMRKRKHDNAEECSSPLSRGTIRDAYGEEEEEEEEVEEDVRITMHRVANNEELQAMLMSSSSSPSVEQQVTEQDDLCSVLHYWGLNISGSCRALLSLLEKSKRKSDWDPTTQQHTSTTDAAASSNNNSKLVGVGQVNIGQLRIGAEMLSRWAKSQILVEVESKRCWHDQPAMGKILSKTLAALFEEDLRNFDRKVVQGVRKKFPMSRFLLNPHLPEGGQQNAMANNETNQEEVNNGDCDDAVLRPRVEGDETSDVSSSSGKIAGGKSAAEEEPEVEEEANLLLVSVLLEARLRRRQAIIRRVCGLVGATLTTNKKGVPMTNWQPVMRWGTVPTSSIHPDNAASLLQSLANVVPKSSSSSHQTQPNSSNEYYQPLVYRYSRILPHKVLCLCRGGDWVGAGALAEDVVQFWQQYSLLRQKRGTSSREDTVGINQSRRRSSDGDARHHQEDMNHNSEPDLPEPLSVIRDDSCFLLSSLVSYHQLLHHAAHIALSEATLISSMIQLLGPQQSPSTNLKACTRFDEAITNLGKDTTHGDLAGFLLHRENQSEEGKQKPQLLQRESSSSGPTLTQHQQQFYTAHTIRRHVFAGTVQLKDFSSGKKNKNDSIVEAISQFRRAMRMVEIAVGGVVGATGSSSNSGGGGGSSMKKSFLDPLFAGWLQLQPCAGLLQCDAKALNQRKQQKQQLPKKKEDIHKGKKKEDSRSNSDKPSSLEMVEVDQKEGPCSRELLQLVPWCGQVAKHTFPRPEVKQFTSDLGAWMQQVFQLHTEEEKKKSAGAEWMQGAADAYEAALSVARQVYGRQGPEAADAIADCAFAYYSWDLHGEKGERCEELMQECAIVNGALHGEKSLARGIALSNYGTLLMQRNKLADGIVALREALLILTELCAPNDPNLKSCKKNMALLRNKIRVIAIVAIQTKVRLFILRCRRKREFLQKHADLLTAEEYSDRAELDQTVLVEWQRLLEKEKIQREEAKAAVRKQQQEDAETRERESTARTSEMFEEVAADEDVQRSEIVEAEEFKWRDIVADGNTDGMVICLRLEKVADRQEHKFAAVSQVRMLEVQQREDVCQEEGNALAMISAFHTQLHCTIEQDQLKREEATRRREDVETQEKEDRKKLSALFDSYLDAVWEKQKHEAESRVLNVVALEQGKRRQLCISETEGYDALQKEQERALSDLCKLREYKSMRQVSIAMKGYRARRAMWKMKTGSKAKVVQCFARAVPSVRIATQRLKCHLLQEGSATIISQYLRAFRSRCIPLVLAGKLLQGCMKGYATRKKLYIKHRATQRQRDRLRIATMFDQEMAGRLGIIKEEREACRELYTAQLHVRELLRLERDAKRRHEERIRKAVTQLKTLVDDEDCSRQSIKDDERYTWSMLLRHERQHLRKSTHQQRGGHLVVVDDEGRGTTMATQTSPTPEFGQLPRVALSRRKVVPPKSLRPLRSQQQEGRRQQHHHIAHSSPPRSEEEGRRRHRSAGTSMSPPPRHHRQQWEVVPFHQAGGGRGEEEGMMIDGDDDEEDVISAQQQHYYEGYPCDDTCLYVLQFEKELQRMKRFLTTQTAALEEEHDDLRYRREKASFHILSPSTAAATSSTATTTTRSGSNVAWVPTTRRQQGGGNGRGGGTGDVVEVNRFVRDGQVVLSTKKTRRNQQQQHPPLHSSSPFLPLTIPSSSNQHTPEKPGGGGGGGNSHHHHHHHHRTTGGGEWDTSTNTQHLPSVGRGSSSGGGGVTDRLRDIVDEFSIGWEHSARAQHSHDLVHSYLTPTTRTVHLPPAAIGSGGGGGGGGGDSVSRRLTK